MEAFIATILLFAGNFAPRGWLFCQGQLLPINQNQALFSLLGTTYGGDGQTTFGLPDLRSRVPVGAGQGPGLSSYAVGQQAGKENMALTAAQLPAHSHALNVSNAAATATTPTAGAALATMGNKAGMGPFTATLGYNTAAPNTALAPASVGSTGGATPVDVRQPLLGLNYIICLEGIYPSRP